MSASLYPAWKDGKHHPFPDQPLDEPVTARTVPPRPRCGQGTFTVRPRNSERSGGGVGVRLVEPLLGFAVHDGGDFVGWRS